MIKLQRIKKSYGARVVVDIPELVIEDGERCAVIGSNGAGKSTLLRILAGTLSPDSGTLEIPPEVQFSRGYMPQHPYIFGFSAVKNVMIALGTQLKDDPLESALEALRCVGMASFAKARGRSLSGGEAQRVAFARMIVQPRKLLVLDEPTSSTDIAGNDLVESALLDYISKTSATLIFSTHSPAQAKRLSDRIIMLDHGAVIENGKSEDVLRAPVSTQGQDFLQHWKV